MATITQRTNKDGSVVYRIRVYAGTTSDGKQQAHQTTFTPDPQKSPSANKKALDRFVYDFESRCKSGTITLERRKFGEYARYIIELKRKHSELKNSTAERYLSLLPHLTDIDGLTLDKIKPQTLTNLYEKLLKSPAIDSDRYILRRNIDPLRLAKCRNKTAFSKQSGIAPTTLNALLNGDRVTRATAEKLSAALSMPVSNLFSLEKSEHTLSPKTVRELHVLISSVLDEAMRDGMIAANPAERARLPKIEKREADFLEPSEIAALLKATDDEPPQSRILIYLLAVSGGRRGEVLGLRWQNVNFMFGQIHIEQTVLYRKNLGIYIDSPKNQKSDRFLKLPPEMIILLKEYKAYCDKCRQELGTAFPDTVTLPNGNGAEQDFETDFLFTQSKRLGYPMHPDTVNDILERVAARAGLRHVHPHMLRHSAASTLIFSGLDVVSVAGYLGHTSPTTTEKIYSHALQEAQNRASAAMGVMMFQRKTPSSDSDDSEDEKVI